MVRNLGRPKRSTMVAEMAECSHTVCPVLSGPGRLGGPSMTPAGIQGDMRYETTREPTRRKSNLFLHPCVREYGNVCDELSGGMPSVGGTT